MEPFRIFIGYDPNEKSAYHVLAHSILRRATVPVAITPIIRSGLRSVFWRERGPLESTEFSISRFLTPFLSGYSGWSMFVDCDFLCLADVAELVEATVKNQDKAILVCQHEYVPKDSKKFLGAVQVPYPRKNWSSLVLFNNSRCRALTVDYVNTASGLDLHRFNWLSDQEIGSLDIGWNFLVGEYKKPETPPKMIHYTLGGPWFKGYEACDFSEEWRSELKDMLPA